MYQALLNTVANSGLWTGDRAQTHAFRLSSSVYTITQSQEQELIELGHALHATLLGLSRIGTIAYLDPPCKGLGWRLFRDVFSSGVPKQYRSLQGSNPLHIPGLLKVDLMVNEEGQFQIAEIDGHNKHGLGYSTLSRRMREQSTAAGRPLPGAVATLVKALQARGENHLKIFYADQERFYTPEFEIAKEEFQSLGFSCEVFSEMEASLGQLSNGVFLDLPFLYQRPELNQILLEGYTTGQVHFVIPPKPCLGAKGVLALIRNDMANEQLESILRSFIHPDDLERVRAYTPETLLVGKQGASPALIEGRLQSGRYVLKESISSGMKGTIFSSDEEFPKLLGRAQSTKLNWVLQKEVQNAPQTFSHFGNQGEEYSNNDWFMRVTVHYVGRNLADITVTARQDKAVHGGKDCIMLGAVVI